MATRGSLTPLLFICLLPCLGSCVHIGPPDHKRQEIVYEDGKVQKFSYYGDTYGANKGTASNDFIEAVDMLKKADPSALPNLSDLPGVAPEKVQPEKIQKYTGLIENFTDYDISIPSGNSGAVLIVPAHRWIEYVTWSPNVHLFGFLDGKQVYYQSLRAQPKKFKYMGNCYDFVAAIQPPPEPVQEIKPYCPPNQKPKRKKRKNVICPPVPKCPPVAQYLISGSELSS
jgi:hypothetical protein